MPFGFEFNFNHYQEIMPSLFKFLFTILFLAGIGYASIIALAYLVEPNERNMTISVPSKRINP